MFENPFSFEATKKFGNSEFCYTDLIEVCQGGPEVGFLLKNGQKISERRFGGPILFDSGYFFVPIFFKKFCFSGFRIAKIDIETLEVFEFGKPRDLIFLEKIENGEVIFFEDFGKTIRHQVKIGKAF